MVLCPAARVSEVISSDTPSCASALRFWGLDKRPVHPVPPDMQELLMQFGTQRKVFQSSQCHLGFEFKIEMVKKVRFGLEVGEQRSLAIPASFAMPAVGALRPCITMMRVVASRIAVLFSSLLGLGIN
jgi:hypothetical protein